MATNTRSFVFITSASEAKALVVAPASGAALSFTIFLLDLLVSGLLLGELLLEFLIDSCCLLSTPCGEVFIAFVFRFAASQLLVNLSEIFIPLVPLLLFAALPTSFLIGLLVGEPFSLIGSSLTSLGRGYTCQTG